MLARRRDSAVLMPRALPGAFPAASMELRRRGVLPTLRAAGKYLPYAEYNDRYGNQGPPPSPARR